ncbi:MAG: glycosyltransferase family 9 protein [Desulfobacterota bacterium]|nr:glycosyltransferase family 9 protein [Thermodesulfobacteriota bacterium]
MTQAPKRILIIRLSAIGDVLRVLPALQVLKRHFPNSYIGWVVEEGAYDLLAAQPSIDEVFLFPKKSLLSKFASIRTFGEGMREFASFIRSIRTNRFDLVIDFHGLFKSGLISLLSGAPDRVGFARGDCKEGNFLFTNRRFSLGKPRISRIERNLALLKKMGLDTAHERPIIHVPEPDREYVRQFFRQHQIDRRRPVIAIHPGTSPDTPYKRWEPYRYAVVADQAIAGSAAQVIFTWAGSEIEMVQEIVGMMKYRAIIAPELHNLCQLAAVFGSSDVFLGSDTGPMHLAAFVGIPVVAVFGPTDHVVNEPYARTPHIIVRKEMPCSPCRKYRCQKRDCIKDISEVNVIKAIDIMIAYMKQKKAAPADPLP